MKLKRIRELMNADATQFCFIPAKERAEVLFVVRRKQQKLKVQKVVYTYVLRILIRHVIKFLERL